jgi:5'-deoxynucleotidase YfbR-like HD superfamily hydrolase
MLCPTFPLEGLLHDASEYVLGDICKPIKAAASDFGEVYEALEDAMMQSVAERFRLNLEASHDEVKKADDIMLVSEAYSLMPREFYEFGLGTKSFDVDTTIDIHPWDCKYAEKRFLQRYEELT